MIRLIILIGIPGSGKSSFAQYLITQFPHCQLISTDQIRGRVFGNEAIQDNWMWVWREISRELQQAIKNTSLGIIHTTIYDATNYNIKQRQRIIKLAKALGFNQIIGVWLKTDLDLCLTRNKNRDRSVPEEVILQMNNQLQNSPPSLTDGFDDLIYLD